jgi:hypothetical protein
MIVHPDITAVNFQANYIDYAPCVNPPASILDYFTPRFIIKKDDECSEIYLEDFTDYSAVSTDDVTITVSVWYSAGLVDEYILIEDACSHTVSTLQNYAPSCGAGYYKLIIHMEYVVGLTTYSKDIEKEITLDCCKCDIDDLKSEVKAKITIIGCKMHEYECMGRDRTNLLTALFSLSSALFYLETSNIRNYCSSAEKVECFLKSIRDFC